MTDTPLHQHLFRPTEKELIQADEFNVTAFLGNDKEAGLRISNTAGEIVILPFSGQQIRSVRLFGRFLSGTFLTHSGLFTGTTGKPAHAHCDRARLVIDEDEYGFYLGVISTFAHERPGDVQFRATPELRVYRRSGVLRVLFTTYNPARETMEYEYRSHVSFQHVKNSSVYCAAPPADDDGYVHAMQLLPTGEADIASCRADDLNRSISCTVQSDGHSGQELLPVGKAVPGNGDRIAVNPGRSFSCDFFCGALSAPAALRFREHLERTREGMGGRINPVALDAKSH